MASASLLEPVFWIKIYLRHAKAAFDLLGLHDHINQQLEQAANVVTGQNGAALAFLDQHCKLFEREFGRVRMDRRVRAGRAYVDVAEREVRGAVAQLRQKNTEQG